MLHTGSQYLNRVTGEEYDSIFIHNSNELYEYLGSLWDELSPETIIMKFREILM